MRPSEPEVPKGERAEVPSVSERRSPKHARRRSAQAVAPGEAIRPDPERRRAGRLVHGEADLLPGLVVARYGDCLSVQTLIEATDARRDLFAGLLERLAKPRAIVERNDVR